MPAQKGKAGKVNAGHLVWPWLCPRSDRGLSTLVLGHLEKSRAIGEL